MEVEYNHSKQPATSHCNLGPGAVLPHPAAIAASQAAIQINGLQQVDDTNVHIQLPNASSISRRPMPATFCLEAVSHPLMPRSTLADKHTSRFCY
jgi:hypothetical protein